MPLVYNSKLGFQGFNATAAEQIRRVKDLVKLMLMFVFSQRICNICSSSRKLLSYILIFLENE